MSKYSFLFWGNILFITLCTLWVPLKNTIPTPNIEMVKSKAIKKNHFDTLLLKKHCLIRAET